MAVKQGDLALLQHPVSQELLQSNIPARLAYIWTDGTPRVVPIWFHWNGREIILGTPPKAPKLKALVKNPKVAITIDDNSFPHKVLQVRGTARLETVNGIMPEYAAAAERYFGREQAQRLDGPASYPYFQHGAYFDCARVGWSAGFPDALSQVRYQREIC